MLHTKFLNHRILGSRKEHFEMFTIYGYGRQFGHVTKTIFIVCPLFPNRDLRIKTVTDTDIGIR